VAVSEAGPEGVAGLPQEARWQRGLGKSSYVAAALAALAVPREGGETVLFLHVLAKTNGGWNASLVSGIVAAFAALAVLFWIIITSGC